MIKCKCKQNILALHNAVALLLQPISLFVFFAASASPHLHGVSHLRENCREETSSCRIIQPNAVCSIFVPLKKKSFLPRNTGSRQLIMHCFRICLDELVSFAGCSCIFSLRHGRSSNATLRRSRFVVDCCSVIMRMCLVQRLHPLHHQSKRQGRHCSPLAADVGG